MRRVVKVIGFAASDAVSRASPVYRAHRRSVAARRLRPLRRTQLRRDVAISVDGAGFLSSEGVVAPRDAHHETHCADRIERRGQ